MEAAPEIGKGYGVVQLRAADVSVVLDCRGPGLPDVLYWGPISVSWIEPSSKSSP